MTATWVPISSSGASVRSVQATTEAAPTLATEGLDLRATADRACAGFNLYAECDSGQTFTGTGDFVAFMYDAITGWARASELDVSVVTADASNRRIFLGAFPVAAPRGRVAHVCSSVAVSGGGVTLYYAVSGLSGEEI
jgi:hypothetical protein